MKYDSPPAFAVGIDERANIRLEPSDGERVDDALAFPVLLFRQGPMLQGAPTAGAKKRRDRRNAVLACLLDRQKLPPFGLPGYRLGRNNLARKGVRHIGG